MSERDRERWNHRYTDRYAARSPSWNTSAWLGEIEDRLHVPDPGARALDLACGIGQHALWLADRGWAVDAWDVSDVALGILARELDRRRSGGRSLSVTPRVVDFDTVLLPDTAYDLVLNFRFLDRRLFHGIARALRPNGLLVFETFVDAPGGRQSEVSPAHLLGQGELRLAFQRLGLETLDYVEDGERGTARLLARKS